MSKIAILLSEGFADWEYGLIAGTGGPYYGFETGIFAPQAGDITSQGRLQVYVSQGIDKLADWKPDTIVVIGGMIWETEFAPDLSELLRDQYAKGVALAGICGGTLALARAGLLDTVAHTSNDLDFLKDNASSYKGDALYQQSYKAVVSDKVITASGTAPASFAAAVFEANGLPEDMLAEFREMMSAEHLAE